MSRIEFRQVINAEDSTQARRLIFEYLNWLNDRVRDEYGLVFDVAAMVESDLANTGKFHPPMGRFHLAIWDGQVAGVGCLKQLDQGVGEIQRMYVPTAFRGQGIGRAIAERLVADAREIGYTTLRLESLEFLHSAHALYRSLGFQETHPYPGNSMDAYQDPEQLARYHAITVFMELSLETRPEPPLEALKAELERFGEAHDATTNERADRMLNITRDTGEFLAVLVQASAACRVLEIGTSNGYSTLWLAEAVSHNGGTVTTVEPADQKIALAEANFARSGLSSLVNLVQDDAGAVLRRSAEAAYDLIFLDAERTEYPGWWPELRRVLRPGGLLVVDNAISHPQEMAPFVALVTADPGFTTCLVPVGKGEFLAVKGSP